MIWETAVLVVSLAAPLPASLLLLDGSRKRCPSCGKLWARTMVSATYTKKTLADEYLNWKVFFDNHFLGFAPESAIPHEDSHSSNVTRVYSCRFCHSPFTRLPGDLRPRLSLLLKMGIVMLAASLADLSALIATSGAAGEENIALEGGAALLFGLSMILVSAGLALQFVGKELY